MKGRILLLSLILIIVTGCAKKEKIDKKETIKEQPVVVTKLENKSVNNLEINNANIKTSDGISVFTADVTNKSKEDRDIDSIKITLKDKNNKELTVLTGYIGGTIKSNETKQIVSNSDFTLKNVKTVEYEIERIN